MCDAYVSLIHSFLFEEMYTPTFILLTIHFQALQQLKYKTVVAHNNKADILTELVS